MTDNCKIPRLERQHCRVGALGGPMVGSLHARKRPEPIPNESEDEGDTDLVGCPETNLVMQIGWRDCLLWSISSREPNFLDAFTAETGLTFPPSPTHAIEAMVDQATGVNEAVAARYVEWFNENVWGDSSILECGQE